MTDNITLPREVVQEALEALAKTPCNSVYEQDCTPCNAEEALHKALAADQPKPEPVAVFDEQMGHPVLLLGSPMLKDKQPLYTAPPALAAETPKPVTLSRVALAWSNRKGTKFVGNGEKWKHEDCVVPLYAAARVDEPSEDIEALRRENERLRDELLEAEKLAFELSIKSTELHKEIHAALQREV